MATTPTKTHRSPPPASPPAWTRSRGNRRRRGMTSVAKAPRSSRPSTLLLRVGVVCTCFYSLGLCLFCATCDCFECAEAAERISISRMHKPQFCSVPQPTCLKLAFVTCSTQHRRQEGQQVRRKGQQRSTLTSSSTCCKVTCKGSQQQRQCST